MLSEDRPSPPPLEPDAEPGDLATLRVLAEVASASTDEEFFPRLVSRMADLLGVGHALAAELAGPSRARALAYRKPQELSSSPGEWDLDGTPCEEVVNGDLLHHPAGVSSLFPGMAAIAGENIEGYLGAPLVAHDGERLGHLCVFDARPLPRDDRRLALFRIFAARAAAELERRRIQKTLGENEIRLRDLFDEAPIAYVHEGLDTRFLRANRAALRILGLREDEVDGTYGYSLVPDTPEAQRRAQEAMKAVGRGTDMAGVVIELKRKDNGRPVWIEWWSRPDPSGASTRTMFIDITDRILMEQEQARLRAQNLYLREEIQSVHNFEEIVGKSPGLLAVLDLVKRVAPTDASVLINGETGTGKELIARAIHSTGKRHEKPLIKVNCAALPTGLVESELFGHEKGAFTGATGKRIGRFELAHGGTIFLDEVGEVPPSAQVKLLRVLQEHEFERVGGSATIKVDVRIISATNRDLAAAVREGTFREDLYYRLNVFPIAVPPLRERTADIPLLANFFLTKFAARIGKRIDGISRAAMDRFLEYHWPGNIRELANVVERAVILASGEILEVDPTLLLPRPSASVPAPAVETNGSLEQREREHILATLTRTSWVIEGPSGAARILDIHPNTLRSRMKKLGISRTADR